MSETSTTDAEPLVNQTITLAPEQVQAAGIQTEVVGERLAAEVGEIASTGTVEANQYRQTPALTLAGGVVRRVGPALGDFVRAGQTVAVVFSDELAQTQSRYVALRTEADNARRNYERSQRLLAINQPGRSELEQAAKGRKAAEAALSEMRNRYERTTRLIRIGAASREQLEQDTTKLRTAEAELEEARSRESRAGQLLPISAEVRAANEEALNKLRTAETELAATRQRLILFGVPAGAVDGLRSASQVTSELVITAPISGTVTSRTANPGEVIEANKEILRVTDLSTIWVVAQVYERDLGRIRTGTGATVTAESSPGRVFRGHVTYIDPQLDQTTRTGRVRIEVANPRTELKIGMYVRAAIGAAGGSERTVPVIPTAALQTVGDRQVVFVATQDPGVFEIRTVRVGGETNGFYSVSENLHVGEKIVTVGSFTLRAEWQKTSQGQQHEH
jgi:multidrug efflux pump subunit AcrA (membrane-fusion protein)